MQQKWRKVKKDNFRTLESIILMKKTSTDLESFLNMKRNYSPVQCKKLEVHSCFHYLTIKCFVLLFAMFFSVSLPARVLFKSDGYSFYNSRWDILYFPVRFFASESRLVPLSFYPWLYFSSSVTGEVQQIKDLNPDFPRESLKIFYSASNQKKAESFFLLTKKLFFS